MTSNFLETRIFKTKNTHLVVGFGIWEIGKDKNILVKIWRISLRYSCNNINSVWKVLNLKIITLLNRILSLHMSRRTSILLCASRERRRRVEEGREGKGEGRRGERGRRGRKERKWCWGDWFWWGEHMNSWWGDKQTPAITWWTNLKSLQRGWVTGKGSVKARITECFSLYFYF